MEKKINVHGIKINPKDIQQFLLKEGVKDDINSIGMLISFKAKKTRNETKRIIHLSSFLENQKQIEISSSPRNIITKLNLSFYKKDEQDKKIPYENLVLTLCKYDEENLYFMCENKNAGIQVSKLKEKKKENKNIEIQVAKAEENKTEKKINARKITINLVDIKNFLTREGVNDDIDSIYMLMSFNNKKGMQGKNLSDLLKYQKQIEIYSGFYNTINGLEISFYRIDQNNRQIPYDKLVLTLYEDHKEKLYFMYKNQNAGIQVSKLEEQKKENKNTEIKVAKEKENQKENENNNKFQVIRAKNRGIEKKINAHRIRINLEDIRIFLKEKCGVKDIDSIYMGVLINEKTAFSRKIGTMPKSRQEVGIKSNEGKPIDKLALVFYRLSENREIIQYGRLVLILHKDENEQLYFMCENSKAKIKVIQVENRDMDKRINARKITINLEDIRNFLTQERGLNDIDPVWMPISLISANHQKRWTRKNLSHLLKSQKQIEISCDSGDIIKELEMSFYRKDEKGNRIPYAKSVLILYKDENKKLYFMCENREAAIRVARVEEDKSAKKNGFAFGKHIFFGRNAKHLIHSILQNNKNFLDFNSVYVSINAISQNNKSDKKFIDLNDATNEFQYFFAYKCGDVMNMTPYESFSLNDSDKDIVFQNDKNLKIDILRMLIRHNNYKNLVEDYGQQDNYRWRQRGYYEIEIEENNYGTGFKYKLVDRNGHIISYGVDYDEKEEVENLTDYLSDEYEDSNGKEFIERFNLATVRSDVVLKDTAKGITLTDKNSRGMRCVCLGTDTQLTFTDLFIDAIEGDEKFSNKFYVLTKSQALKHIASFILLIQRLPFESLSFIDQKIVQSYDTKKSIGENLNGKDMVTLRVDDIKIDPKLESNKFSDDLAKLCQIDDGFQCAVVLIELLSKIKTPNSNFKYQLNSVKDGNSILETRDIFKPDVSKTLVQAQNNTEGKTSWLEAKKAQAFKLQPEPSENNNSNNKPFSEL